MNRQPIVIASALLTLVGASSALACLWDYDTLAVERARFPDALELITGNFARHSKAFYEWRVADREKRIAETGADSDPAELARLYDDLAVAHEKLGRHDKAIETIRKVEEFAPGRYETYANLGTFHIHKGELEEGLGYLDQAIEINPEAHFGREVYQRLLLKYVLEHRDDSGEPILPLDDTTERFVQSRGFAKFVLEQQGTAEGEAPEEIQSAVKGVLGMMRFGNHESPILLEALGDLMLHSRNGQDDSKRLAARAYLAASYRTEGEISEAYRVKAQSSLGMQTVAKGSTKELKLPALEQTLKKELATGKSLMSEIEAKEARWIKAGQDPEENFRKEYLTETVTVRSRSIYNRFEWALIAAVVVLLGWPIARRVRRNWKAAAGTA